MAGEAGKVLKRIALSHFEGKYGNINVIKLGGLELWEIDGKKYKPYFCTDQVSKRFTGVALSQDTVDSMIKSGAYFMPIQYYWRDGNKFRVYSVQPELLLEHYIHANLIPKKGTRSWHITIRYEDEKLIFTRRGASEVVVPIDENNYCSYYQMDEDEYRSLREVLGIRESHLRESQKTLKVVVSDKKGTKEFSILSAIVIAVISVLVKSRKPLTRKEILNEIIDYGVLTRGKDEIDAIKRALKDLAATGGLVASDGAYSISDDIKIDVEL